MSLPGISFERTLNNLGRLPNSDDGVVGFLFPGFAPAEFGSAPAKQIFSVQEAEDLGITSLTYPIYHYIISEFYRMNPNAEWWAGFYAASDGTSGLTYNEVVELQLLTGGRLKLIGIYSNEDLSTSMVQLLHLKGEELWDIQMPAHIFLTANIVGITPPDLSVDGFNCYNVTVQTDQSGDGVGKTLFNANNKTIGALGALLGSVSRIPVSTAVTYVGQFSDLNGTELDVIATGDGTPYDSLSLGQINAISNKRYLILMKHTGYSGTYWGKDYTSAGSGDFDNIRNNRTINKVLRVVKAALTEKIGSPTLVDPATGNIAEIAAASLESIGRVPLDAMRAASEISGGKVFIDRNQKPNSSDAINVQIDVVPVGAAMNIKVTLSLKASI